MYQNEYNFKRLAVEDESSWDDVINRFINELVKRGCKTSKKDLEWLCLNYYALPNSPALSTAGNKKFFASACSSYPITDSMDEGQFSILNTLKISSMATKAGIGCVDASTEFFTGVEWKRIAEYEEGDLVAQYKEDGYMELVNPNLYYKKECDVLYHFQNRSLDQCLSDGHNVVFIDRANKLKKKPFRDIIANHNRTVCGFRGKFITTFKVKDKCGFSLTEDEIRLMVAFIADGSFHGRREDGKGDIRVCKERKRDRLIDLLEKTRIKYTLSDKQKTKTGSTIYGFYFKPPINTKTFSEKFYDCTSSQLQIIIDEVLLWDGSVIGNSEKFFSSKKEDIDFIQYACSALDIMANIMENEDRPSEYTIRYAKDCTTPSLATNINIYKKTEINKYKTVDGYMYCFNVPSGMLILRRGGNIFITGNTGFNFSNLRSKEEMVQGRAGTTGGPVSFLRAYNGFIKEITQATRKSASMGLLHVNHPDILDYINCKQKDGEIENFNLSVVIDDAFMEAVEKDEEYVQPYKTEEDSSGKQGKIVKAKDIFDIMCQKMWESGEPGVMFADTIKRDYFTDLNDDHILANPCFTGGMKLLTIDGYKTFEELNGKEVDIINKNGNVSRSKVWCSGKKRTVSVKMRGKDPICCTPDHVFMLANGNHCEAEGLEGKRIKIYTNIKKLDDHHDTYIKLGFIQGDGELSRLNDGKYPDHKGFSINFGRDDLDAALFFGYMGIGRYYTDKYYDECKMLGFSEEVLPNREFPSTFDNWNHKDKLSFLCGMYSANGSVISADKDYGRISYKGTCYNLIKKLSEVLSQYEINSYITTNKEHDVQFKNGSYLCKESYDLNIIGLDNIVKFYSLINFIHRYKREKLETLIEARSPKVLSVTSCGDDAIDVYDFVEPKTNWGVVNGIVVHNCSEALLSYGEDWLELCVLASINLPKFMALKEEHKKKVVDITVSMLNDIINLQDYVTPLQEKGMKHINRKIGIGVAGLATVLAQKNIKYSSEEGKDITKGIFKFIGQRAKVKSESMFVNNLDKEGKLWVFGNKIQDVALKPCPLYDLKRFNTSLLSVAPTSSLSNIFNDINQEGCSYGIEPYFSLDTVIVRNSFGDFSKNEKIIDILGEDKAKEVIECANDLDYKAHLGPVEAYYKSNEKGIVQGCSKTINFRNNVSLDDVKEAVIYCWKHGIKAISFYRDGSRKNQVMTLKDTYKDCVELDAKGRPVDIFTHQSPKRPEFLDCDIHHTICDKRSWLVMVGLFKGKPYEVFAGLEENISIPKKYKQGRIQKKKGYHLVVGEGDDELIIKDIPKLFENPEFATLTRITSFSLRHGGPLKFVIEQLQKDGVSFDSFNKVVARVLKKYIVENETIDKPCPNCGGALVYISGCPTCTGDPNNGKASCGYSRCS